MAKNTLAKSHVWLSFTERGYLPLCRTLVYSGSVNIFFTDTSWDCSFPDMYQTQGSGQSL